MNVTLNMKMLIKDVGDSEEVIAIEGGPDTPFEIAFSLGYLSDGVRNVQGDTYDWLHATGTMSVDGTMVVRLAPGYIPPRNTVFTLVSGNTRVGQFSSVTLPTLPATLGYPRVEYTNNAVRVRVPLCPTDWNAMDGINSQDFFDFLNDFFAGTGDFNFDGFINSQDFFDFLTSFFGGCEG